MTRNRAEQIIVISLFVLLASTVGGTLAQNKKSYEITNPHTGKKEKVGGKKAYGKMIVGGFLTMFFASLLAEAAPEPAALLAVSVSGYAFFTDGLPAINAHYAETRESAPNLHNPLERLPATPGPEVTPEPLKETSPVALRSTLT